MLTATETARVQNFTAGMDAETAAAIMALFTITKPGCDEATYDLMNAAHTEGQKVSAATTIAYAPFGLVLQNGSIPAAIKSAVRKAVAQCYLTMHGPEDPALKPDLTHFIFE